MYLFLFNKMKRLYNFSFNYKHCVEWNRIERIDKLFDSNFIIKKLKIWERFLRIL